MTRAINGQTAAPQAASNSGPRANVYAAIDLGTNNCRLLVARPAPRGFRVIDAFSRIVRLGEGLSASGTLAPAAMERTLAALKVCARKMHKRRVTHLRAVATEACRRAENCQDFLVRVEKETGITLEIISNSEEAHLALHGCAPLLDRSRPHALIFDIGGGSTQISWLTVSGGEQQAADWYRPQAELRGWLSVPHGVVTLAEDFDGENTGLSAYEAMVGQVSQTLRPFEQQYGLRALIDGETMQMVGTSGTVTTLAGLHLALPRYERAKVDGCHLSFDTIADLSQSLATMSLEERLNQPCIGRDRADLVVAGCAILEAICRTWPVGRLRVGDRGLREGILFDLMCAAGDTRQAAAR